MILIDTRSLPFCEVFTQQLNDDWSYTNPHWFGKTQTQYSVMSRNVLGPICIDGEPNGATYLELLGNTIDTVNTDIVENDDSLLVDQITFQHGGKRLHYAV